MFTISDICHIAVQIEKNGEDAYRQAAKAVDNPGLREVLHRMAEEEYRHGQWFEKVVIQSSQVSQDGSYDKMEAMGRALLQEMMMDQTFSLHCDTLTRADSKSAIIEQSIEFETDTITFYEMMLDFVEDGQVRQQLDQIIHEEKNHIDQLNGMKPST